jgi:predicted MFS family arabinose efflux permease
VEVAPHNHQFRRLWLARVVSFAGDAMGLVALILYVAEEAGSGTAVALLLLAGDFIPTLLSPIRVIVVAEPPLVALLALVAIGASLAHLFQAVARSTVPDLVADEDLERADALIGGGTHGLEALGPLLAAALLRFLNPLALLAIDALTFLVSPVLLVGLPRLAPVPSGRTESASAAARTGIRFIWRDPVLRPVVATFVVVVAFNASDVALVFLGRDVFGAGDSGVSLLFAGAGVGLLLGFALIVARTTAFPAVSITLAGFVISRAGNLLTGLSPVIAAAFAMQLVRGIGISLLEVGPTTLVQRLVPRHLMGRVFANLHGAVGIAAGLSYVLGGYILDRLSPRVVLVIAGTGGIAASAVLALRSRSRGHPKASDEGPLDDTFP